MAQFYYDLSQTHPTGRRWPFVVQKPDVDSNVVTLGPNKLADGSDVFTIDVDDQDLKANLYMGLQLGDFDAVLKMRRRRNATKNFVNTGNGLYLRSDHADGYAGLGYYVALGAVPSSMSYLGLYRRGDVGDVTLLMVQNGGLSSKHGSLDYGNFATFLRVSCIGSQIKARVWWEDEPEPETWPVAGTDATFSTGDIGIQIQGYSTLTDLYFLSVGTQGDSAPLAPASGPGAVAGSVKKPDGTAADGYLVRCYDRASGAQLGETLTDSSGAFAFTVPAYAASVYCLAVDQLGNTWNAPVADLITPAIA